MNIAEIAITQDIDDEGVSRVLLTADGNAIPGVVALSIGSDQQGSYIDVRIRQFRLVGESNQSEQDDDTGTPE